MFSKVAFISRFIRSFNNLQETTVSCHLVFIFTVHRLTSHRHLHPLLDRFELGSAAAFAMRKVASTQKEALGVVGGSEPALEFLREPGCG